MSRAPLFFILCWLYGHVSHAAKNVPLIPSNIKNLGFVSDAASNTQGVFHDGGGGASQNGYHVQVFADSMTTSGGFNFVHNSIAYYGLSNPNNPTIETNFGMSGAAGKKTFSSTPLVAITANETAVGANFAIWMVNGLTPLPDGKTILGVFPCLIEGPNTDLYSTMVSIEVVDPKTIAPGGFPPTKRLGNGRLFYAGEVQYGNFALEVGNDGYLYLFGSDNTGVKLARTPYTSPADRNQYKYYNGASKTWQTSPLKYNDATGNVLKWSIDWFGTQLGPNTGDVWYDSYHGAAMMVFMDSTVDGVFWASYATNSDLTGPWSTPVQLWSSPIPNECKNSTTGWNYQGHVHSGYDPTGKTLLLSYASCELYVSFALLTWK